MDGECGWVGGGYGRADVSRADADRLRDECKERKKENEKETLTNGCVWQSRACGRVGVRMCCVWVQSVWTRISVKKKKKKTYLVGCERVDALACRDGLDVDDCEDKRKEKKNLLDSLNTDGSGCRCWWNADG